MENLEQRKAIINLGKLLVKELGLEDSGDTLSRWMAHYVAEKIKLVEHLPPGRDRDELETKCFEIILRLWEQRWILPSGKRPLESFEPILRVLLKIDPDSPATFYRIPEEDIMGGGASNPNQQALKSCLDVALQLDKTFKIWMSEILMQAAAIAKNDTTNAFLEQALNLEEDVDVKVILAVLSIGEVFEPDPFEDDYEKQRRIEKIERSIVTLERFAMLNEATLGSLKNELLRSQT